METGGRGGAEGGGLTSQNAASCWGGRPGVRAGEEPLRKRAKLPLPVAKTQAAPLQDAKAAKREGGQAVTSMTEGGAAWQLDPGRRRSPSPT